MFTDFSLNCDHW